VKIVGYTRVSTQEQVTEGMSLDAQENRIRSWAEVMGHELVSVIADEGVSGTKLLGDRPGGAQIAALIDSRRPSAEAVVVVRTDRLGRDAAEQIALLKRFRSGKVGLVAIAQQIDLATPHGRAMAQIGAVFNELERALIAERTAEALSELRRQGRAWNHAPFGWRNVGGVLEPEEVEQVTLRRAMDLRSEGTGYATIARILTEEARPTKRGGPWQAMSVRSILRTSAALPSASRV
jgi:site-specific DNA recombinase